MACESVDLDCAIRETVDMDLLSVHQWLYERTGGRVGHRIIGVPSLLLRTMGRRTGQVRVSALVYARDSGDYLLVASNGGSDRPPGWLFNIEAKPDVEIQVGQRRTSARARIVTADDPGYPRLWQAVNDNNHGRYTGYQVKTSRKIPVVVITPAAPAAA
jgi:F420H(2)-dependent quinone reductase